MTINRHLRLRPRMLVFAASGLLLIGLVVSRSLGAYLADAAPQAALWFDAQQPEALVNVADEALITASSGQRNAGLADQTSPHGEDASASTPDGLAKVTHYIQNLTHAFSAFETIGRNLTVNRPIAPANAATVRRWATAAVMNDPLNARALRILGQLAEADSDDANAARFMQAADNLSLHEPYASYWLMRHSAAASDYQSAIYYADVLLRTNPQSDIYVVPVLAEISADKAGAALLKTVLADNPPWRRQFIAALPNNATDVRIPLDLLLALRTSPVPPTNEDLAPYINFLIARKSYELAYYTWLQFLPPEQLRQAGLLFNGSFEAAPSGLPFDWKITQGAGVTVEVVQRPDKSGQHALLVDFKYGRVDYHSVTELVMLAPGTYEFNGEYKGQLAGPRGMKWRVVCANNGTITSGGESQMIVGVMKDWKTVAFTFTVPDKDCAAQYVRLDLDARMASEQLISGSILFDDLQISRVAPSPPPSGG